jgi:tRNA pseudouridine38-40 synthase
VESGGDGEEAGACQREYVLVEVIGKRFLHKMVRIIVGTLVDVGRGVLSPSDMQRIIDATDRHASSVSTAPARGLSLVWTRYD